MILKASIRPHFCPSTAPVRPGGAACFTHCTSEAVPEGEATAGQGKSEGWLRHFAEVNRDVVPIAQRRVRSVASGAHAVAVDLKSASGLGRGPRNECSLDFCTGKLAPQSIMRGRRRGEFR